MKASIIVTCKGRRTHLEQTIPYHVKYAPKFEWELLVVDYGCPGGAFDFVKELNHPNIGAIKVKDNVEYFNLSRARNIGATYALGTYVCFCDADVYPRGPWLRTVVESVELTDAAMTRPKWRRGGCGICCLPMRVYKQIRGHDEALKGWGWEDIDLKSRAEAVGSVVYYDASILGILKHSREASVMHYEDKRIRRGFPVTNELNRKIAAAREGLPNPNGWGQGDCEVWRPTA